MTAETAQYRSAPVTTSGRLDVQYVTCSLVRDRRLIVTPVPRRRTDDDAAGNRDHDAINMTARGTLTAFSVFLLAFSVVKIVY